MTSPTLDRNGVLVEELTRRERQVLELLADGRTNAEIAERMDVAWYTARNHVSNILGKLGVSSRDEAASWWREHRHDRPQRQGWTRRWAQALLGLGPLKIVAGAGAVTLAAGAGVALTVLTLASWPGNEASPDVPAVGDETATAPATPFTPDAVATPDPTSTPESTPTPELPFEVQLRQLSQGAASPIEGFAVVVEEGCLQCDAPPAALRRYSTDPAGELRSDLLFEAPEGTYINYAYDISHDMQRMLVTVCSTGGCGGVGEPSEDASVTAYESLDGGITWEIVAEHDGPGWFFLSNEPGEYVLATWADPAGGDYSYVYRFVGETEMLTVQEAAGYTGRHIVSEDGKAVLLPDGSELWRVPDDRLVIYSFLHPHGRPSGWVQLRWEQEADEPFTTADPLYAGTLFEGMVAPAYNLHDAWEGRRLEPHGWIDDRYVVGTLIGSHSTPVLIDTQEQTFHPLAGPFPGLDSGNANERAFATAAVRGPFARVVSGEECLNVREAPGTGAQVLGCYADGVLLRTELIEEQVDGTTWLQVLTPENEQGWAAAEFLEYGAE